MMMEESVLCLAFNGDSEMLASGGHDGKIKVLLVLEGSGSCVVYMWLLPIFTLGVEVANRSVSSPLREGPFQGSHFGAVLQRQQPTPKCFI